MRISTLFIFLASDVVFCNKNFRKLLENVGCVENDESNVLATTFIKHQKLWAEYACSGKNNQRFLDTI